MNMEIPNEKLTKGDEDSIESILGQLEKQEQSLGIANPDEEKPLHSAQEQHEIEDRLEQAANNQHNQGPELNQTEQES